MKKLLTTLCVCALALVCLLILPTRADAASYTEGDYTYTVSNDEATITKYNGYGGDITIPGTLGSCPVTTIGKQAFLHSNVSSVIIPDSVTTIEDGAFLNSNLQAVRIGKGVSNLDRNAFDLCYRLCSIQVDAENKNYSSDSFGVLFNKDKTVLIKAPQMLYGSYIVPSTVTRIGDGAFWDCADLTTVTIPDSVTTIAGDAFLYCHGLTTVHMGCGITNIGSCAFDDCSSLTDVYFNGIQAQWNAINIGSLNDDLTGATIHFVDFLYSVSNGEATITRYGGAGGDVVIPATLGGYPVTTIFYNAFRDNTSVTSVEIPDSVTTINDSAFWGATSLVSVKMGKNVTAIGDHAFYDCTSLKSVELPKGLTTIEYCTFCNCEELTSVTIPDTVTTIGNSAFYHCYKLTDVYYGGTRAQWDAIVFDENGESKPTWATIHFTYEVGKPGVLQEGDYLYFVNGENATICRYTGSDSEIILPDTLGGYTVTAIEDRVFESNTALKTVVIGDSITAIGEAVFSGCDNLQKITIGSDLVSIGSDAFANLKSLTKFVVDEKNANYSSDAFGVLFSKMKEELILAPACLPEVYEVPYTVATVKTGAFALCRYLSDVTFHGVSVVEANAFPSLQHVRYLGPKETWESVSVGDNNFGENCTFHSINYGYLAPTCTEDGYHVTWCPCGEEEITPVEKLGHEFLSYGYNYDATCTADGTETAKCSRCAETHTQTVANSKLGHSFTGYKSNHDATCTANGTETAKCDRCEKTHTRINAGSKLGHSFTDYKSNNDATCTLNGTEIAKCDRCDVTSTRTEAGSAKGHDHEAKVTLPTCLDKGYTTHSCHCGDTYVDSYTNALGHNFTNYKSNNDATCTADGTETAKCDRCNATNTRKELNSAKGHSYESVVTAPTCLEQGYVTYTCHCGDSFTGSYINAQGHSFTDYKSNNDATCTEDGTETAKCDRCDVTDTRTALGSAKGHSHTKKVTKPTCTAKGYTTYTCVCGDTYKANYTNTLGHSYKSGSCTRCKYKPAGAKITTQPVNVAVKSGKTAKVTVKATGSGLKYQWYYAKKGAKTYTKASTTNSYSVKMSTSYNGTKAYCVITDQYGNSVKSNVVTLYKGTPAKITTQPKGVTVASGKTGKLTIKASGSSLKYTWYVKYKGASSFTKVGSSSKTYSFKMASKFSGAQAYCVVKDKFGIEVKSSVVTIKLAPQPKITTQPKSVTQVSGKTVKFTMKASGDGLKYQWYYAKKGSSSFKKLSGKTSATYSVKVSSSVNGRKYYCLVTDKYGQTVKSSAVTLTMKTVAKITTQPKNVSVKSGKTAKVTIKAVGDGLKYTWYYLQPGATKYAKATSTGASHSVKMAAAWKNAKVYCVIADKYGNTVKSSVVTLKMK